MASDLKQSLERISSKARLLVERYNVMYEEKKRSDERVEQLSATVSKQQAQIQQLQQELDFLKIASTITPDRKQIDRTRQLVAGLVREIDRCILELKE